MTKGLPLELFFFDGDPDGMVLAEVFNWTGSVLKFPRTLATEALARVELERSGVYLLSGETEKGSTAYVGEGEKVASRLKEHMKAKDWWSEAIVITTAGDALNKAHIRYLESAIIGRARSAARVSLDNSTQPGLPRLSEAATANMDVFLSQLELVLPALGVTLLTPQTKPIADTQAARHGAPSGDFVLRLPKESIEATALVEDGKFIVRQGSRARGEWIGSETTSLSAKKRYFELVDAGLLVSASGYREFSEDVVFASPSAAAAVVTGRSASGPREWIHVASNLSYGDWEARRIDSLESEPV